MRWRQLPFRSEEGQVTVFVAIAMLGLIAVVGLVADGGRVFAERRDLQNVADAAALAGAMQIDVDAYRSSGDIVLDEGAARDAAVEYLSAENVEYAVQVSTSEVEVAVSRQAPTTFLKLIGIEGVGISASSSSSPRHGISEVGE